MLLGQNVSPVSVVEETCEEEEESKSDQSDSHHETTEEEPDFSSDGCYEPDTETDTASENEEDVDISGDRYTIFTYYDHTCAQN